MSQNNQFKKTEKYMNDFVGLFYHLRIYVKRPNPDLTKYAIKCVYKIKRHNVIFVFTSV